MPAQVPSVFHAPPERTPEHERARLAAVHATGLIDAAQQPALDRLTRLASRLLRVPTASVTLVDETRQVFASCVGVGEPWASARGTPLSHSFCRHVVQIEGPLVIEDAREHPVLRHNLAVPDLGVIAYAGMPLVTSDGHVLGSFCAIDYQPRAWSDEDLATLEELTRSAAVELELRAQTRRLAEQTHLLDLRSEELRQLVDATGELVCAVGPDWRISFVNRAWREALGYSAEEAAQLRTVDLVAPEDRARYVARARRLIAGETVEDFAAVMIARDGRRLFCRGRAVPIMADTATGRRCVGTRAFCRDVTAEHHATIALRASEARLSAALEGGRFGFVALRPERDADGAIVDFEIVAVNGQSAALIGMPEDDLVGQRYGDLLPLAREAGHVTRYAQVLATGEAQETEVRVTDPRFDVEWVRVQVVPFGNADGDGAPDGVALMIRDVSAEKRAAREVRLLVDVTYALSSAPDLAAATGAALHAMCAATGWEYGEAWLVAGGDPALASDAAGARLQHGPVWHADDVRLARFAAAGTQISFGRGEGLPGRAWSTGTPVVMPRLATDEFTFVRLGHARAAGLRSGVAIPVLADGEVVAVLAFHTRDPHRVGQANVALLAAVAAQVGTVVRRKLAEAALRASEARFRGVLENLRAPAVQLDAAGRVTFANAAVLTMTGWTHDETIGANWFTRFVPDAAHVQASFAQGVRRGILPVHHEGELLTRGGDRRLVAWDNVALRGPDDAIVGVASIGQDITERRALEARLAALSEHDELTGLLNRRGFHRMAAHALKSASRTRRHDAVLYIDLDRFKPINDTYGHAAGDAALRSVADLIRATVRDTDVSGRLGGDEFAIFAFGMREGDGHVLASRLRAALAAHNGQAAAAGRPFAIEFSVGVAELEPADDLDALIARADAGLYAQKCARRTLAPGVPSR